MSARYIVAPLGGHFLVVGVYDEPVDGRVVAECEHRLDADMLADLLNIAKKTQGEP
jgi:hypothetical protein